MKRLLVMLLALAAATANATAGDDVSALMDAGKYSEALRVVEAAIEAQPTDAQLRHFHSQLLVAIADYPAAIAESLRAIELAPESAEAHAQLGTARTLLGDEAGARDELTRALELAPDHEGARAQLAELDLRDRIRRKDVAPAPGTPEAAVFTLIDGFVRRAPDVPATQTLAPDLLDELLARFGGNAARAGKRDRALLGFLDAYRIATLGAQSVAGGILIEPAAGDPERPRVTVQLLWTRVLTDAEIIRMRELFGQGRLGKFLQEEKAAVLAGLDAVDRAAYFSRQAGVPEVVRLPIELELARDGQSYRVRDVALVPASGRRLALTDVLLDWDAFSRQTNLGALPLAAAPAPRRNWARLGAIAGAGLLAVLAIVFVIRRKRRT